MSSRSDRPYKVGYGNPPIETQFRKGQSGNPLGRPKGSRNKRPSPSTEQLSKIILDEAYRDIRIHEDGRSVTLSMAEAVMRSLSVKAAKGDHRSQRLFTEMVRRVEANNKALYDKAMEVMITYTNDAEAQFERCLKLGKEPPDIVPHPDDITINEETGYPYIAGPLTHRQKREFEKTVATIKQLEELIAQAEECLENEKDPDEIDELRETIRIGQAAIKRLDRQINGWRPRS